MRKETIDVLVIGAGFAGICVGIKLLEKGITGFRIVDKSNGVGGTWYENRYPGAACDVQSHLYCFSFEPNPNWSRAYAPQAEILQYIEHCVDKYGLRPYIMHQKKVVRSQLNEERGFWETDFADGERIRSRHVIAGNGGLHVPSFPAIAGRDSFTGIAMHTAQWDHTVSLEGKRVAVIGTAASAVQIVPELAKQVGKLTVFQRTPNYIASRNDRAFSAKEKARLTRWPILNRLMRWTIFMRMDLTLFPLMKKNSWISPKVTADIKNGMRDAVKDETLHSKLLPDYQLGCKRILISDDFYATFNRENVTLVSEGIERIDETGIVTADGVHHAVDALIYATGFDMDKQFNALDIRGKAGEKLSDMWADIPLAYKGVCVSGFPNFWLVTGPNTGVGTMSIVFMIEQTTRFIVECIELSTPQKLVGVTEAAMDEYNRQIQSALKETVWASGCKSWYMREDGRIATLYPYNARAFRKQMRRVNREHFEVEAI